MQISAVLITFNEEHNIEAARALGLADAPSSAALAEREDTEVTSKLPTDALRTYAGAVFDQSQAWLQRVGSMWTLFFQPGPVRDWPSAAKSDTERFARFFRAMLDDWTNEGFDPFAAPSETGTPFGKKRGANRKAVTRERVAARRMVGLPAKSRSASCCPEALRCLAQDVWGTACVCWLPGRFRFFFRLLVSHGVRGRVEQV